MKLKMRKLKSFIRASKQKLNKLSDTKILYVHFSKKNLKQIAELLKYEKQNNLRKKIESINFYKFELVFVLNMFFKPTICSFACIIKRIIRVFQIVYC